MHRTTTRLFALVFLLAVAVNFAWEMAQSGLYAPMGGWLAATWRCVVASLGDGVIVLTIAVTGWVVFGRPDWFVRRRLASYAYMLSLGIAVSILIERRALAAGRWAYTEQMPIVPVLDVGLVPVLQMAILPPLVLSLVAVWFNEHSDRRLG
jgi:hypothetical protein